MFGKLTAEEIRQAFDDIAQDMIKGLGDWESTPPDKERIERIYNCVVEAEKKKEFSGKKSVIAKLFNRFKKY